MDSLTAPKSLQEFEPRFDWVHHSNTHVLIVHLLGFRSNQLKVQVTSTGKLRIAGERKLGSGKLLRFQKEFEVPKDADTDKISAKLEDGLLYIRQPVKTTPNSQEQSKPKEETKPSAAKTADKPTAGAQPIPGTPKTAEKPTAGPQPIPGTTPKTAEKLTTGAQPIPGTPKGTAGAQSINETAAKSNNDKPKASVNDKKTTPAKPKEETKPPASEIKKAAAEVQDPSKEIRQKAKESGEFKKEDAEKKDSKKAEEVKGKGKIEEEEIEKRGKSGEVGEEKTGMSKETVKRENGGGGEAEKKKKKVEEAAMGVRNESVRRKMVRLILGVLIFVIFYMTLPKKPQMVIYEEEL